MSIFNRLNQLLLIVTSLIVATLLALGVWTYQNRVRLLDGALREVERVASEAIGVPLTIGGVGLPLWGELSLKDVKVYGSNQPGAPVIASAPEVRATYSLLEILQLGAKSVRVEARGAQITITRDSRGQISYQPTFKPATGEAWEPPTLPPIAIAAQDGTIRWIDSYQRKAPFVATLQGISGRADLVDHLLTFEASGREQGSSLEAKGLYRLVGGSGAVEAKASRIDVPRWVTYLAPSKDWWTTRGLAEAAVKVAWSDPGKQETFAVTGRVTVTDGALEARNLLRPVEHIQGEARFDRKDVILDRVTAMLCGNLVTGSGKVVGIDRPWKPNSKTTGPTLDIDARARGVDLKSLEPLVKDLDRYAISGTGEVTGKVSGYAADPVVTADLTVPEAHVVQQTVTNASGTLRYQDMVATLPTWTGTVHGGSVTGSTTLAFGKGAPGTPEGDLRVTTSANWSGVDLAALIAPYMEEALPLKGQASGSVMVSGPADRLKVEGQAVVAGGAYAQQAIDTARATFRLDGLRWEVPEAFLAVAGSAIQGSAHGDASGSVQGRFQVADFPLERLRAMGVEAPLSGAVTAEGILGGNLQHPEAIRVSGKAQGARITLDGQRIDEALVRWSFAGKRLDLPQVEGKTAGGQIMGAGHLILPEASGKLPDFTFDLAATEVDAGQIEPLQRAVANDLGAVRGAVTMTARVESQHQALRVKGNLEALRVDAERFGGLDRIWGPIYYGHGRLTLPELRAKPTRGTQGDDAELIVRGSIDLTERAGSKLDPVADLTVSTIDANLRQIMEAVHWQQLLRGTWIGRRLVVDATGPAMPAGDLPGREDQPLLDGTPPLSFAPLLDHWKAAKKEPLPANELFLASRRPFWQAFEGRLSADITLTGPLSDPDLRLRTHVRNGKVYGHRLETAQVSLALKGDRLVVPYASISSDDGGSLYAKGILAPGQVLEVYGERLDLAWINPWLQVQEIALAGRASVTLRAQGTLDEPHVELSGEVNAGKINEFAYDRAQAKALYEAGRLTVTQSEVTKDGRAAHVTGSLPIPATADNNELSMDMDLDGESLGLVSIFTKGEVEWLGGPGSLKLALGGTIEEPKLTGNLELQGGRIGIKALEGPLTNVVASASIGPKGVVVQKASAQYGGGRIMASGTLAMSREFKPEAMRFQVSASRVDLKLQNKLYQGMTGATLEVTGKPDHPVISGIIALSRGTVLIGGTQDPNAEAPGEMIPVTLKDLTVQLGSGVLVSTGGAITDLATMKMDVTVEGNLIVNGMLDDPQPKGVIEVRGGTFTTVNTEFRIVSDPAGRVEFLGGSLGGPGLAAEGDDFMDILSPGEQGASAKSKVPNARLDVTAQARVWDYNAEDFRAVKPNSPTPDYLTVTAHVMGSLRNMEISFESNPPLSQDRILQVLGKESLIASTFRGSDGGGPQTGDILRREVTQFVSSGLGQVLNTQIDQWLADMGGKRFVEEFRMDLVSGTQAQQAAETILPNLSLYGQTRPLGPLSLNARYTFRGNTTADAGSDAWQNYYQVGLNYRLNAVWSLQAGLDNGLPGLGAQPAILDWKLDDVSINVPITVKAQFRF